jgi:hypothetical protein
MSESLVKSRILPLAALGATLLTMTGCRALGWRDSTTFLVGCPPETPKAKVGNPLYTDVPNSYRNRLEIDVSCTDEAGNTSQPVGVSAASEGLHPTIASEVDSEFTITYAHDVSAPPVTVESIDLQDPENPGAAVITMRGMYDIENVSDPTVAGTSR